ncbi:platelet-activating factor acetylhydrolase 2, cytoplasmic-like [Pelobates fuscus]|uniref:platelet-activating factor acetylhydrolase 2, cytoplasmic-like n=1 Tax=Pelobates fuscus TaxID=191477 RepID=UPI002FE4ADD1
MGAPLSLTLPPVSGPHSVGATDVMVKLDKEGSFFRLFYPCSPSPGLQHPLWAPRKEYLVGLLISLGFKSKVAHYGSSALLGYSRIPVAWNAPFVAGNDRKPVIIFSHGLRAFRTVYSTLCRELASYGYLVAAVEHRDGSACATYHLYSKPGNENVNDVWVPFRKVEPGMKEFYLRNYQVHQRATECARAVRVLEDIDAGKLEASIMKSEFHLQALKGRIDFCRVAVMGHSFGGASALLSLVKGNVFRCAIALDAWMFPLEDTSYPKIQKPTLFINNEHFQTSSSIQKMRTLSLGCKDSKILTILGSVHHSPTDFAFFTGYMVNAFIGSHGTIDPHICLNVTVTSALDFLHKHLDLPAYIPKLEKLSEEIRTYVVADVPQIHSSKL